MAGLPWFRMYVDFLDDPKMVGLAFEDQRHFFAVCALKCAGILDQNTTPEMLNRIVAQKIWVDYGVISDVKDRLKNAKLIDEFWNPISWEKRQKKSDSSADRVRKHREKQKVSECNGDVTLQQRYRNALDKIRVDKSREEYTTPNGVDFALWVEFLEDRKKRKASNTDQGIAGLVNKLASFEAEGYDPNEIVRESLINGWKSVFKPKTPPKKRDPYETEEWQGIGDD